jgi:hypothetical protein
MSSFAKANAILRDVADKLTLRFPASASAINTVRQTVDSAGWPMIILSHAADETASHAVIALRMKAVDMISKDIFGNALTAYAPHALEIAFELDANGKPTPAESDLMIANFEAIKTGVKIQLKQIVHATAVSATSMDAASVAVEVEDLYWPTKGV